MLPEARYVWSAYAFPTAVTTVLMLALGASVLIGQRNRVARAFFGMTAASAIWLFTFTFMYCARDAATALGWARAAYFGIPFLAPAIYQFSVETLQLGERRRLATFAGWALATAFSLIATSSSLLVPGVTRYWWGFYPRYATGMSVPFLTFFFAYLIAALIEFVRAYPRSRGEERTQIQLLLGAFAVAYLGCVDYLPKFGFAVYPFGYLGLLGFAAIVGAALRRYGLLAITPSIDAPEILATMGEALLVCDAEERIRFANGAAERLLGFAPGELEQRPLAELLEAGSGSIRETLPVSNDGRTERVLLARDGTPIDMSLAINPIVDHGRPAGVVIIGHDIREKRQSEREAQKAMALLQSTLDSTADGILVTSNDGRILTHNHRYLDMWHVPAAIVASGDSNKTRTFVLDQLTDPDQFTRIIKTLYEQPEAESFDLLEFKDGRRFERYSIGRKIEGVGRVRFWSFRDVTARFASEAALRESEHRYRLLFEQNAAGVFITDLDGRILDCNPTFASMLRSSRKALIGAHVTTLHARPMEREEVVNLLRDALTIKSFEVEMRRMDGSPLWVLQNLTLLGDQIQSTVVDIHDRKRAEDQIEFHAYHDVLTQLPNRRLFTDRLTQNLTRARRFGKSMAVMFVDLDHFKRINDTLGHESGDELLLEVAHRLRTCVREDDTVARVGGDEFTIALGELRHPEDALTVAQKIIDAVQSPMIIGRVPVEISASIGIALFPADGSDPETLIRNADSAMYRAKDAGRGMYQVCTEDMKRRATERLSLEARLKRAIAENQLVLHYQPQMDLTTGSVTGVEALVRWNDPERGLVYPSAFLPLAEETRLIIPLGEWVLRHACAQMVAWKEAGLAPAHLSVNLSARQFQQTDLAELVRSALDESGLDPIRLELEVTETAVMRNAEASLEVMRSLRTLGVHFSIDDFGTGYTSLPYLKQLPISSVKIERTFIRDLGASEGDTAVVTAALAIARSLKLRVIAEGVETIDQVTFLRQQRCDAAQGFYFSRPVPAEAIPSLLAEPPSLRQSRLPRLHI